MKLKVVPEPSERWTTAMVVAGRLTPGLSSAIAGSFQFLTLPAIDVGEQRTGELELARLEAGDVHDRDDAADHDRELREACSSASSSDVERLVGRAEVDRAGLDLRDAAAGADRLIVDRRCRPASDSPPPRPRERDRRRSSRRR